jgi:hypothetical protein
VQNFLIPFLGMRANVNMIWTRTQARIQPGKLGFYIWLFVDLISPGDWASQATKYQTVLWAVRVSKTMTMYPFKNSYHNVLHFSGASKDKSDSSPPKRSRRKPEKR